ncbi:MAG: acyl-CoA carboxylase subunit beta [Deltaproteobacteria bacterium]|nr:MAG: acyl-CoA carboxylase subunit beta [Deltaproteobacteria bacterium]
MTDRSPATPAERAALSGRSDIPLAHARLETLFDAGSFDEIGADVVHRVDAFGLGERRIPGDGVVTGAGTVEGRTVFAYAQDRTVLGGSLGEAHAMKIARLLDLADRAGAPIVALLDSGGARIQEGVDALAGYGEIFRRSVRASGRIPQIAIVCGPCAGGAVYSPALMDFTIMVDRQATMFLTGPRVVRTVTFEDVTAEALGGGEVHAGRTGVAHFLCDTDTEAIATARALLRYLPSSAAVPAPQHATDDPIDRDLSGLGALLPASARTPYDVRDIVREVLDRDSLLEVHARWAANVVVAFGRIAGHPVGVVANQPLVQAGCLDSAASRKAARFIRTCDAVGLPLVSFVDVPGFLPGRDEELQGAITHGAKLLYAWCEATVPRVGLILRKAYGGAYIVMNSKHVGADVALAWPSAEIAVMGARGAVEVLLRRRIAAADDPAAEQARAEAEYAEHFLTPRQAAERGHIDAVIPPEETRRRIARALAHLRGKTDPLPPARHRNMPT